MPTQNVSFVESLEVLEAGKSSHYSEWDPSAQREVICVIGTSRTHSEQEKLVPYATLRRRRTVQPLARALDWHVALSEMPASVRA